MIDKLDQWMNKTLKNSPGKKKKSTSNSDGSTDKSSDTKKSSSSNNSGRSNTRGKSNRNNSSRNNRNNNRNNNGNRGGNKRGGKSHSNKGRQNNNSRSSGNVRVFGKRKTLPKSTTKEERQTVETLRNTRGKLKVIPLGGLNEVGKNMMAIEYDDDIIIIDMGFEFPSEDMLGVDYVIPDVSYLEENKDRIRGVIITHAHLDHIGGIPYIIPKLNFPPLYGTKLTMGLIEHRCKEFGQEKTAKLRVIDPDQTLKLGVFNCSFFRVVHSIPDCVGIVVDTPVGKIVHTGDFKFDESPAGHQRPADIHKLEQLGNENVLALFADSTNSLKPGTSLSEEKVGETLGEIVRNTEGRLIIASFSSLIGRIQQIIDHARTNNRQVYVSGRSMRNNVEIAKRLGYLNYPPGLVQDIRRYKKTPDHETLILTTGSQGEAVSALHRIAHDEHSQIKLKKNDTVVLSSSPIIGNERQINTVINRLCLRGARVIHNQIRDVHTSGHGNQEELKRMINYVKPKYLVPVHGEYYMRQGHAQLAMDECGFTEDRIIMLQNGDVLMGEKDKVYRSKEQVETKYVLIDGLGEGNIGSQVLMDREMLGENGALIILLKVSRKSKKLMGRPDIISRGFMYMHETDIITEEVRKRAAEGYKRIRDKNPGARHNDVKRYIAQSIDKYTRSHLERRPLIVPLIMEA